MDVSERGTLDSDTEKKSAKEKTTTNERAEGSRTSNNSTTAVQSGSAHRHETYEHRDTSVEQHHPLYL